jgi:hypothetical protein
MSRPYVYGGHIRAEVRSRRTEHGLRWSMVVRNDVTGEQITSDNGWPAHELALNDTGRLVAAARLAWSHGFGKKRLVRR